MHGGGAGRGRLVHQFGSPELPEPSTLPFGDSTDMGYSQSEFSFALCVNVLVRPTRISPRQSGRVLRVLAESSCLSLSVSKRAL